MSFFLLLFDELKGFYKSKVMIFLWIGLPVLALLLHGISPAMGEEMPLLFISSLLISSIGGTLASVMLTVSIIHEKDARTYDLFLIRPIKRWHLMISKFFAVFLCITIASIFALSLGVVLSIVQGDSILIESVMTSVLNSFIMSLSVIALSSAAGVVIGVISPSVIVGVIVVIYIGSNLSILPVLPSLLNLDNPLIMTVLIGVIFTVLLLTVGLFLFNRKQF
jgi:ABC-2 type transport system permease protein